MALVVETGAIVDGANTLVNLQDYKDWLSARGFDAPVDDATGETELIRANDYLEELYWKGSRIKREQPLQWPRYDTVDKDGFDHLSHEIPTDVVLAQIEIAYRIREGFDPSEQVDRNISSESVDVLSVTYQSGSSDAVSIHNIPRAQRLLKPYLRSSGGISRA